MIFHIGDCIDFLPGLENKIDIVFTDPPFFDDSRMNEGSYQDYVKALPLIYNALKRDSWLAVYFPSNRAHVMIRDTEQYFEYVDRFVVVYDATTTMGALGRKKTIGIYIFKKGRPKQAERFNTDIIYAYEIPGITLRSPKNPIWKPTFPTARIIKGLLGETEDRWLLDPFAGYGSILLAGKVLGMKVLGAEIDEERSRKALRILHGGDPFLVLSEKEESEKNATLEEFGGDEE